jgi:hypothetical protein
MKPKVPEPTKPGMPSVASAQLPNMAPAPANPFMGRPDQNLINQRQNAAMMLANQNQTIGR